jgi:Na+-transporting NADH:ubiquinone oxidoreductase subunit A
MSSPIDVESRNTSRLGLLASDYRGLRCEALCEQGELVAAGAAVMRDARRPSIVIAAPAAGRIVKLERGAGRRLVALHIEADASAGVAQYTAPGQQQDAQRAFLLQSGSWASLRTRPFGNIPDPDAQPAAILVTAIDAAPQGPPVAAIIDAFADEFSAAVSMLARISEAPLYLCHAAAYRPPFDAASGAICRAFSGDEAAGLPGRHIQALCPIGFTGADVWHIGYQETIALGHLIVHGQPWLQRIVALAGDAVTRPRCLQLPPGAAVDELLDGEIVDGPLEIYAGSALYGRRLGSQPGFLRAGQRQLTVNKAVSRAGADAGMSALIPGDWLERFAPPGIYPVPLMRALQLGDAERARELGALELVEEDVAPLTAACVSNSDYPLLLRRVLDQLEELR